MRAGLGMLMRRLMMLLVFLGANFTFAEAAENDQLKKCIDPHSSKFSLGMDAPIRACEAFLKAGAGSVQDRWTAAFTMGDYYFTTRFGLNDHLDFLTPKGQIDEPAHKGSQIDLDRALAAYTNAIEIDSQKPDAYLMRARALHANHDLDGAIRDYSEL